METAYNGALVGFCNPLLDIVATVDAGSLEKYSLKTNDATLATLQQTPLFKELIETHRACLFPGGSGQNALHGAQLLLPANSTVFIGAVGQDKNADKLREAAKQAGLHTDYIVDNEKPTGTCALLITSGGNSMVADLSAAQSYQLKHTQRPEAWSLVSIASVIYVTGFFLAVSPETVRLVALNALANKHQTFALNVSAPSVVASHKSELLEILPLTDVLFGSSFEVQALCTALGLPVDPVLLVKRLASWPKRNGSLPRLVVFTADNGGVVVGSGDADTVSMCDAGKESSRIVDMNGAGDAFVAGFLAMTMQGFAVDLCVEAGVWMRSLVVQRFGASYPDGPLSFEPQGLRPTASI
ncbi:adenosine kinase [Coemansia asiatica]|uniref:Adenosine kinase n=1 Tax=Coemansia asiatica TaxID=1052880 RepID=A0A9W8CIW1_9FUNG|nr:adenosine kinase [Coemansia asiatica]